MSDDADITDERMSRELEQLIDAARNVIPLGTAGTCTECGTESPRLIKQDSMLRCAPCRDMLDTLKRRRHYSED
jgi:RNA polymerase-binding transcription factor DksA